MFIYIYTFPSLKSYERHLWIPLAASLDQRFHHRLGGGQPRFIQERMGAESEEPRLMDGLVPWEIPTDDNLGVPPF